MCSQDLGENKIHYLRCRTCQEEFRERKNTALWHTKTREAKAVSVRVRFLVIENWAHIKNVHPRIFGGLNARISVF